MRGKDFWFCSSNIFCGITPACAGKSQELSEHCRRNQDHPRVCGEKYIQDPTENAILGSPPRVRGKALHFNPHRTGFGITPAYAGKRIKLRKRHSICRDHPRVCGEKDKAAEKAQHLRGSPPRVRGKVRHAHYSTTLVGITPACAGKSNMIFLRQHVRKDHPRVCGEKLMTAECAISKAGSPPRMRGKGPAHYTSRA